MSLAFLGSGNMAAAIVDGLLARGGRSPAELACLGGSGTSATRLTARTGIRLARDTGDLLAGADLLVVAFKPQHLASADPRLADLTAGRLVVSLLAGKRLATLARTFPRARALVRAMPNTPGRIGAGITGWCSAAPLAPADRRDVENLLAPLGSTHEVPEELMDAVTAVGGSGPGFVFEFTAALRDAALAAGLPGALATDFARRVVAGAGRLLEATDDDPETLRQQVTSPHGTTAAGLASLAAADFRGAVRGAVEAARARAEQLARDD
jgi:pyrroline-5-carboxylate reductase